MTFDSFVVGSSNKFVFAACEKVAENPGIDINPLYIFGNPGLGKTHLLNAVANQTKSLFPEKNIVYATAENFVEDFVSSIKSNNKGYFNKKYNDADVLLIDDIQFFSEKMPETMKAFFNLFETLRNNGKQIIISADVEPDLLNNFHKRLQSRLKGGLYFGIDTPETELKINYIRMYILNIIKNESKRAVWNDDIIKRIAETVGINMRELSGFISNLVFYCDINNEIISESIVDKFIRETNISSNKEISPDTILSVVAKYYNINEKEIKGNIRIPNLVKPRHIAMYLCRKLTNYTTTQIGNFFNKDHSAVISADKKIRKLINEKTDIFDEIERISILINER